MTNLEVSTFGKDTKTRYRITSEADAVRVIEELERDKRTGLYRAEIFDGKLDEMLETAYAQGKTVALAVCDLDHFKKVNDTYGHETGHKVLRHVAQVITQNVRTTPTNPQYERRQGTIDGVDDIVMRSDEETVEIGRVGGEEFGIALYGLSASQAYQVAERVRKAMEETPYEENGLAIKLTMSIGVATTETMTTRDDLYHGADKALYAAKADGRNCIRTHRREGQEAAPAPTHKMPATVCAA